MKKVLICILLLSLITVSAGADEPSCSAKAMILYEPRTGTVLAEKNADERLLVASTTKIMTALVVLEHCSPEETVRPTAAQAAVEGSSMYLRAGEAYTVEELLFGLLLASGNDAALALAEHTAGSAERFAALMNDRCAALGLRNTHFVNPHGLDDPQHYSSARDLAVITAEAMKNETFCRIFASAQACVHGVSYQNHNKLLDCCPGCIGGKTGYTQAAGRVLVSCTERDGLRLICVTVSDPDDWNDHMKAYDDAFSRWRFVPIPSPDWGRVNVISGTASEIVLESDCPGLLTARDAGVNVRAELPRFVFAPVRAGDELGRVTVYVDGKAAAEAALYAGNGAERDPFAALTRSERFRRGWERYCRYSRFSPYPCCF